MFRLTHSKSESQAKLSLNRLDDAGFDAELSHMPQPVFHSISQTGNKQRSPTQHHKINKQYITPEHNEMIKYVQRSWKGVERDYKKSVNNLINNIDLNSSSCSPMGQQNRVGAVSGSAKKKTATTSKPLLLSGSYHHTSILTKEGVDCKQDSFRPFDLEAFWGNRILKRLTADM